MFSTSRSDTRLRRLSSTFKDVGLGEIKIERTPHYENQMVHLLFSSPSPGPHLSY